MWRIIPNIPKALRGNWNNSVVRSAPPTSCHDEDTVDCNPCQNPSPVYFIHRNLCCYRAGKRGKKKYKERAQYEALNRWVQSFKQDWSSMCNPLMLEAFGYGTVLLLGIHLSQYYKLWHDQNRRKSIDTLSPKWLSTQLGQMSLGMPIFGWDNHFTPKHAPLPVPKTSATEQSSAQTTPEQELDHQTGRKPKENKSPEFGSSIKSLDDRSENLLWKNDTENCDEDLFCDVERNWSALGEHYLCIGRNVAAYQYTQQGDIKHAIHLWHQSSDLPTSSFNLGVCYELGQGVKVNLENARQFYEAAAKQGHHKAMYNLARMYMIGKGINQDLHKAVELLKIAASGKLSKALCDLGVFYASQEENKQEAFELFKMAAKSKDACGCYNLAVCYQTGCGVETNLCKAVELYKKAAELGHRHAQLMLAVFFQQGLGGLPVDEDSARAWLNKAETLSDDQSSERYKLENMERYYTLVPNSTDDVSHEEQSPDRDKSTTSNGISTTLRSSSTVNKKNTKKTTKDNGDTDFLTSIGLTGGRFGQNIPGDNWFGSSGRNTKKERVSDIKQTVNNQLTASHISKDMDGVCDWSVGSSNFNKNDAVSMTWTRC